MHSKGSSRYAAKEGVGGIMGSELICAVLAVAIATFGSAAPCAERNTADTSSRASEKLKAKLTKLGTGPEACVNVGLRDGAKVSGYVSEAEENEFRVTHPRTGTTVAIAYDNVKKMRVHRRRRRGEYSCGEYAQSGADLAAGMIGAGILFGWAAHHSHIRLSDFFN
jgi:hypothetical protein